MKRNFKILYVLPISAVLIIGGAAVLLYRQLANFEKSYLAESQANIAQETRIVAMVIAPMLEQGKLRQAIEFCDKFKSDTLRLSLIDSEGRVAADSAEKAGFLGNHLDRAEVKAAFEGRPAGIVRYSSSLGKWMMYHAELLKTANGDYVLRSAVTTDKMRRLIDIAKLNIFLAVLFGGEMILFMAFYLSKRVHRPLNELQNSAAEIAAGKLDSHIEIPETGVVRELALGISEMAEQLKKRLSEADAERNEKNAILDAMDEAVLLFGPDGNLLRCNLAAAKLFELPENELKFNLSRCGIAELPGCCRQLLETDIPFAREFPMQRGNLELSLFVRGSVLMNEGERCILLTVSDLTNLRKLEAFRSDFIANVSHEIKTPLTGIIGSVEALVEEKDLTEEQKQKLFDMLSGQSRRLNLLVQDILSLAALEKRRLNPKRDFQLLDLDAVVDSSVSMCARKAAAAGIELEITTNPHISMEGDFQLLEQALVNLIQNAVKYSNSQKIDISLRQEDNSAILEVRDYGVGIAPEHAPRIFERFYRVHKERSRESGGTGLGLAIVKHIAALHGGHAQMTSTPGSGCSFKIILPL